MEPSKKKPPPPAKEWQSAASIALGDLPSRGQQLAQLQTELAAAQAQLAATGVSIESLVNVP